MSDYELRFKRRTDKPNEILIQVAPYHAIRVLSIRASALRKLGKGLIDEVVIPKRYVRLHGENLEDTKKKTKE